METEGNGLDHPHVVSRRMARWFHKRRYVLSIVALLSAALGVYWVLRDPPLYRSTVVLHVDQPVMSPVGIAQFDLAMGNELRRVYHDAISTAHLARVAAEFDLGAHYGISPAAAHRKHRVVGRLRNRLDVHMADHQTLVVTVHDHDRDMARRLAVGIHKTLLRNMEARTKDELRRTARVFQRLLAGSEEQERKERERMSVIATDLYAGLPVGQDMAGLLTLTGAGARMTAANQELVQMRRSHQLANVLASHAQHPSMVLVRAPAPDLATRPVREAVLRVIGLVLLCTVFAVLVMLLWDRHRQEFWKLMADLFPHQGEGTSDHPHVNGMDTKDRAPAKRRAMVPL